MPERVYERLGAMLSGLAHDVAVPAQRTGNQIVHHVVAEYSLYSNLKFNFQIQMVV